MSKVRVGVLRVTPKLGGYAKQGGGEYHVTFDDVYIILSPHIYGHIQPAGLILY